MADHELSLAEGYASTKFIVISSFALLVYDHLTCLDQEFKFLWNGGWSLTRILYFMNRYVPPLIFILQLVYLFTPGLPLDFCTAAIRTSISFEVIGVLIVEAVLVTRVYYLWSHSWPVQYALCMLTVTCGAVAIGFSGNAINSLQGAHLPSSFHDTSCINVGDGLYWPIYLPTFIIQTILFVATVFRILRPMKMARNKTVVDRLLRDGALFYLVVLISVGFTGIGSILVDNPLIAVPALTSNLSLAIQSICASHLILSIHSLAAGMGSDPKFLLSNLEISRVAWRLGKNANELVVEIDVGTTEELPVELSDLDPFHADCGTLRATHSRAPIIAPRRAVFERAPPVRPGQHTHVIRGSGG